LPASSSAAVVITASSRARHRSSVPAPMPTSRATTSTDAPSGGSNRATALSLNDCPYRATTFLHRRPQVLGSMEATSILTRGEDRFAVAIAIGAACFLHPREPKPSANVFIAIGDNDQVTGIKPCQDLAHEYAAAGGKSTVKVYSGATSGFDGDPVNRTMFHDSRAETFVNCNVVVEPDGSSVYEGKKFAETNSSELFVEMRKSCIKIGASGYTNVTQKANVTLDLIDFLDANFHR
jgi:hypothetical protein